MKSRRSFSTFIISFLVILAFVSCEKEDILSIQDQEKMQKAIESMNMAYNEAEIHNSSLKDAISTHAEDDKMQFYDSSFHHSDSLYQHHLEECESLCSGDNDTGMMMNGGCSSKGAMMGKMMMGRGMQMDCSVAGESCQHAMGSLREEHSQYCPN
jgi:hypothetical protein